MPGEEEAVGSVVDQALDGIGRSGRTGEVIVVDNGSTDRSAEVVAARGAQVDSEPRPGYGSLLVLLALVGMGAIGVEWAAESFGDLGRAYETALLATLLGLGIQIVFGAFFLALITIPLRREAVGANDPAVL